MSAANESLRPSALDREPFRAPAQHAAREIRGLAEPGLLQHYQRLRRTCSGTADRDHGSLARKFVGSRGELTQRNQRRTADVAKRSLEFLGFANVDDLRESGGLFESSWSNVVTSRLIDWSKF